MKRLSLLLTIFGIALSTLAQHPTLLPYPQKVEWHDGYCNDTTIHTITRLAITGDSIATQKGYYRIDISKQRVDVITTDAESRHYAEATLAQLHTKKGYPCVTIEDWPNFQWRGAMLDLSRHYFPLEEVYKHVDILARYKINRLHLHLTDAAGWRMEIKHYPRLTELAAYRSFESWKTWWDGRKEEGGTNDPLRRKYMTKEEGGHGGYYTQEELRQLVIYAESKGITIIPEIEMPAHSEEVLVAYPELSCTHEPYKQADFCPGNPAVYEFLENVLTEVMSVFPSEYIHVGGDEAGKASWKDCARCQHLRDSLGTTDVHDEQTYLIMHMARFLKRHGRQLIGWDEVIEGTSEQHAKLVKEHPTIMLWRGAETAKKCAQEGLDVIMCPGTHCYFDFYQDAPPTQPEAIGGYTTLDKVYSFNPLNDLTEEEARHIIGVQGNVWAEYIPTPEHQEYMLYPRILALAELGWSQTSIGNFRQRAIEETDYLRAHGVNAFDLRNEKGERREKFSKVLHKALNAKVTYNAPYADAYKANGDKSLTDGKRGGWANNDGIWQGFIKSSEDVTTVGQKARFDVTLDLGKKMSFKSVSTDFMQACGPEIFWPSDYIVQYSNDGETWKTLGIEHFDVEKTTNPDVRTYRVAVEKSIKARFIRVQATPSPFSGWLFCDEVVVK